MSSSDDDDDDVPLGLLSKMKPLPPSAVSSSVIVPMTVSSSTSSAKESTTSSTTTTSRKRPNYNEESEEEEFNDDGDDDDDDEDFAKEAMPSKKKKNIKEDHVNNNGTASKKKSSSAKKSVVKKEKKVVPIKKEKSSAKVKKTITKKSNTNGNDNNKKVSIKDGGAIIGGLKAMDKAERISHGMQAYLWWNANDPPKGCQWSKMEHAGVSFPEPYIPHNVKMLYDGNDVTLSPVEEEAATFFAAMDPDGMHLGNSKTAPIFIKNFMADFKSILGKNHVIKEYSKCDFGPIRRHLDEQKLVKKAITDNERKTNKSVKDAAMFKFGYALVDGHLEKVGNYNSKCFHSILLLT